MIKPLTFTLGKGLRLDLRNTEVQFPQFSPTCLQFVFFTYTKLHTNSKQVCTMSTVGNEQQINILNNNDNDD